MWDDGVFLSVKCSTGEIIIGDKKGVWVSRTVRRKPEEERWDRESIKMIVDVPWRKNDNDANADGENLRGQVRIMDKEYRERMVSSEPHMPVTRRMHIKREDLENFGYTVMCPGCTSLLKAKARQAHSEQSRKRWKPR